MSTDEHFPAEAPSEAQSASLDQAAAATPALPVGVKAVWKSLADDRVVRATILVMSLLAIPLFAPVMQGSDLENYALLYLGIPLSVLEIAALRRGLDLIGDTTERRFWNLLTVGCASWLAQKLLGAHPASWSSSVSSLVQDGLYLGLYVSMILAVQLEPHRRGSDAGGPFRAIQVAGTIAFALGIFAYFALIPGLYAEALYETQTSSLVMFEILDGLLLLWLLRAWRGAESPRWRAIYGWLLATALLWFALDAIETLMNAALLPMIYAGSPADLPWMLPTLTLVIAARIREHPFELSGKRQPGTRGAGVLDAIWGDPLVAYAAAFPLLHFALFGAGVLDPATRGAREVCALALLASLAGMAIVYQKLLLVENERLQEARVRAAQAERLAFHDALTGLPNRYLLMDRLDQAIARARRQTTRLGVMFLDLDRFKVVNDSLGHSAGDSLLKEVAARLRAALRRGDTLARLGGDEFTVLLEGIADPKDAVKVANHLRDALSAPFEVEGRELFVTTSMGICLFPDDAATGEALLRNADAAMYRAKEQGRDGYSLYTAAMNSQALERLRLESQLRRALGQGQFALQYQPILDTATGRIEGCEALLRWRHPDRGLLLPGEFVELAELTGVIMAVGPWVLEEACREARSWRSGGDRPLTVAVNLSPRQFLDAGLVEQVAEALEGSGLEPERLELEITESLAMQNAERTVETLRGLKGLGVRISIDDFGTGYSSLAYLRRFPLDTLKIDKSFIDAIHREPGDAAIAATVISMARALSLRVVAEGVERREQLQLLRELECHRVQGFLFSRPCWPEDLRPLLREPGGLSR